MGAHVRGPQRHVARTLLAAGLVVVAFAGYVAADIADLVPGPLTRDARPSQGQAAGPAQAWAPARVAGDLETGRGVDAAAAQGVIDTFAATPGLGSDYSVLIADADGTVAAERDQENLRQPASTLKTLTAAAAAGSLDMGSTIPTEAYLSQSAGAGAKLTLKGQGDMLLGPGASDPNHVNGRAGLGTLAQETAQVLKARSISKVSLAYDAGKFGSVRSSQGIEANNPGGVYFTPTSAMAVDEGRQRSPQDRDAAPDAAGVYVPHDQDPEGQAARVFAQRLREQGIDLEGEPSAGQAAQADQPLAQVQSAPLIQIMAYMLRTSDNTLAELFGRLTAIKEGKENSPEGAVQAVGQALEREGIKLEGGAHMADCSGLSPGSQVSVTTLAAVQRLACDGRHGRLAPLVEGLSVAGLVGTAANRGRGPASGLARVKTGSLDQVTAMTGNVSRTRGGLLVFAVIVNNPSDMGAAVKAVDTLLSGLPQL